MVRTKRYGGFLVGDRVRVKDTAKTSCKGSGRVMGYNGAKIVVESYPMEGMIDEFMPNQLINLTRIEEKKMKEIPELPPINEGTAKELNDKVREYIKILEYDPLKNFKPTPFEDLFKKEHLVPKSEMNERLKKQEDLLKKKIKAERDFVAKVLRQTEIFISPLTPYGDLPSPYTRDVYTSTKDY